MFTWERNETLQKLQFSTKTPFKPLNWPIDPQRYNNEFHFIIIFRTGRWRETQVQDFTELASGNTFSKLILE